PQPQAATDTVSKTLHFQARCISEFPGPEPKRSNLTTTGRPVKRARRLPTISLAQTRSSLGPRDIDVVGLQRGAHAADHLAGPEIFAQESHPSILGLDHGAERVTRIGGLISIEAAERKLVFELRVGVLRGRPGAHAECFRFKAREQLAQLLRGKVGNDQAARSGLTICDGVRVAEFAYALHVAEKIEQEHFL